MSGLLYHNLHLEVNRKNGIIWSDPDFFMDFYDVAFEKRKEGWRLELSICRKLAVPTGCLFLALTFCKALILERDLGVAAGVCFMLLAALSLLLLRREGVEPDKLSGMFPLVALALFIRVLFLDHVTLDYETFLHKWVEHFRQFDGFAALKDPVGNYNVPYLYVLAFLSYLPIPDLYGIKLFSILFDILLAWGGLRLTKVLTAERFAPLSAFAALLFLPTVILNGSAWGQCDSVWAAFCVHALVCGLENRPKTSLALLALAFSVKLQAVFLIPLWCALWFTGRIRLRHFPVFPAAFFLTMLPALLAGKPPGDILRVYIDQAGDSVASQTLNYNSPSIFAFLPYKKTLGPWAPKAAIALAFLLTLAVLLLLFRNRRRTGKADLVLAGAALTLGIPFLLPYMHERYFFLGVVLLTVLACVPPHGRLPVIGAELASLGGYHAYLLKRYVMPFRLFGTVLTQPVEGGLMLFAVISTLTSLWRGLQLSKSDWEPSL